MDRGFRSTGVANDFDLGLVARADSAPRGNRGDFAIHPLVSGGK
jgi:hypothetical protein